MQLAALASVLIVGLPVQATSEGCPSGPEVEEALASMLSSDAGASRDHVARVQHRAGKLQVELVDASGTILAERTFDSSGTCAEQAKLAAVFIASWESEVHPEFTHPQTEPPVIAPVASEPARPSTYELAAGITLGLAGSLALGGSLGAAWFPRGVGPGFELVVAGESARTMELGTGRARWRRWTASPEAAWRWARGRFVLDTHAGITFAWLVANGVGFYRNETQQGFALAGTAGLRSAWWLSRHLAAWLELRGFAFAMRDVLWEEPSGAGAEVPRFAGILSIGAAFGRGPSER